MWKIGSTTDSNSMATTVCAILSATVGTPSVLTPPPDFGISTAFTGGGKYVPEESLFQILYRLFFRSFSNPSTVHPSAPGAPLLAFTLSYASHTARLEIANGFPAGLGSSTRFLPLRLTERMNHEWSSPFAPHPL